ncbi:DUF2545 family protein [Escherichia coli]|nr:DUF2545 family protein [Escherichia coli]
MAASPLAPACGLMIRFMVGYGRR